MFVIRLFVFCLLCFSVVDLVCCFVGLGVGFGFAGFGFYGFGV